MDRWLYRALLWRFSYIQAIIIQSCGDTGPLNVCSLCTLIWKTKDIFENNNVLDGVDRWFERGVREAI